MLSLRELKEIIPVKFDKDSGKIRWINQRKLPLDEVWKVSDSPKEFESAIKTLEIRGAPTIGVYAAYVIASLSFTSPSNYYDYILKNAYIIRNARPTAVNLSWAVDRMLKILEMHKDNNIKTLRQLLVSEAVKINESEYNAGKSIGINGRNLIKNGDTIFTRCNAGMLACAGSGTSYAIIRQAWQDGKDITVIVPHTAPLYQGARLTMWECEKDNIPAKLIADDMVGYMMSNISSRKIVLLGADRILSNGNVANKIGTYQDAILAKYHNIPFYVAAPSSTIDTVSSSIPVEMRNPEEVKTILGKLKITTEGSKAVNPAFDITPNSLISSIITEKGIANPPFILSLKSQF